VRLLLDLFPLWLVVAIVLWLAGDHVYTLRDERRRLRSPEIDGTPLPAVDDPRWEWDGHELAARFGTAFVVQWHNVIFEGRTLGEWEAYAEAVRAPLMPREAEARAARALAAITEAATAAPQGRERG
jgi:hypothetical protein